jgi:hypothetical protein
VTLGDSHVETEHAFIRIIRPTMPPYVNQDFGAPRLSQLTGAPWVDSIVKLIILIL